MPHLTYFHVIHNTQHALPMLHSNNLFALGREIRILHAGGRISFTLNS